MNFELDLFTYVKLGEPPRPNRNTFLGDCTLNSDWWDMGFLEVVNFRLHAAPSTHWSPSWWRSTNS